MIIATWPLQEAKNRLTEVVRLARLKGPQVITSGGAEVAVVVSLKDFERLSKRKSNLVEFFRNSPLVGVDLRVNRRRKSQRAKASRRKLVVR